MKGLTSKDGKMSGNVQTISRYDSTRNKGRSHSAGMEHGGMDREQEQTDGHDEIRNVVAEHGAAHEVHIKHDHDGGHHHVTSHHADGYTHEADHSSAPMAHAHAAHAAGVDAQELHDSMHNENQPEGEELAANRSNEEMDQGSQRKASFMSED